MALPIHMLLQIADSALPTGAFAYSNGLEALARAGRFPDAPALEAYLHGYLGQAREFDLAFVSAAHAAGPDAEAFAALCLEWDASFWNASIRKASLRQGRALLDVLAETFPGGAISAPCAAARDRGLPLHFAPALGQALFFLGASREQACRLYLHGLARDQAAAAVRLGLIGPRFAQALQARLLARAEESLERNPTPLPENAWRSAPLVEAGQGGHDFLYSRLFQN